MGNTVKLTAENFEETVGGENTVAVIDFYADWCGPCKMFAPIFEEMAAERNDVVFCKVNVDESPELASKFEVMAIPTVVVLKGGVQTAQNVGVTPKQMLADMINA